VAVNGLAPAALAALLQILLMLAPLVQLFDICRVFLLQFWLRQALVRPNLGAEIKHQNEAGHTNTEIVLPVVPSLNFAGKPWSAARTIDPVSPDPVSPGANRSTVWFPAWLETIAWFPTAIECMAPFPFPLSASP
jgi:hypothetical protein